MKCTLFTLLISLCCQLGFVQTQGNNIPIAPYLKTKKLPSFTLLRDDSTLFDHGQLLKSTATVFVYFNSDCDHCQQEAKAMVDSVTYLTDLQVVFVSNESFQNVKKFAADYQLTSWRPFTVTVDLKDDIYRFFEPSSAPFVVLYDKRGNYIQTFVGGTSVANIRALTR